MNEMCSVKRTAVITVRTDCCSPTEKIAFLSNTVFIIVMSNLIFYEEIGADANRVTDYYFIETTQLVIMEPNRFMVKSYDMR